MKIHIVQKGDTLWNLSKQYNVDFQALKAANSQIANPEMIMPGMKIKIPVDKKHVGQAKTMPAPKEKTMPPYKQIPTKAQPVIKEDDHKPKQKVQKKIPYPKLPPVSIQMPKLPNIYANQYNIDLDIDDHDTTINTQQTTHHHPAEQHAHPVEAKEPVKTEPVEQQFAPSMMWMPCLPFPMMPCPPQMPVNLCDAYQNPAVFNPYYGYPNYQWQPEAVQSANQKWGELDLNQQQDVKQQFAQYPYYQMQWPMQHTHPYNYNYASYAPRDDQSDED